MIARMKQNFGVAFEQRIVDEIDRRRGLIPRSRYIENIFARNILGKCNR